MKGASVTTGVLSETKQPAGLTSVERSAVARAEEAVTNQAEEKRGGVTSSLRAAESASDAQDRSDHVDKELFIKLRDWGFSDEDAIETATDLGRFGFELPVIKSLHSTLKEVLPAERATRIIVRSCQELERTERGARAVEEVKLKDARVSLRVSQLDISKAPKFESSEMPIGYLQRLEEWATSQEERDSVAVPLASRLYREHGGRQAFSPTGVDDGVSTYDRFKGWFLSNFWSFDRQVKVALELDLKTGSPLAKHARVRNFVDSMDDTLSLVTALLLTKLDETQRSFVMSEILRDTRDDKAMSDDKIVDLVCRALDSRPKVSEGERRSPRFQRSRDKNTSQGPRGQGAGGVPRVETKQPKPEPSAGEKRRPNEGNATDAMRKVAKVGPTCYRCKKPGHLQQDCQETLNLVQTPLEATQEIRMECVVNGKLVNGLVDTGASRSFMSPMLAADLGLVIESTSLKPVLADGSLLKIDGMVTTEVVVPKTSFVQQFYVANISRELIVGMDMCVAAGVQVLLPCTPGTSFDEVPEPGLDRADMPTFAELVMEDIGLEFRENTSLDPRKPSTHPSAILAIECVPGAPTVYSKQRRVPLALSPKVDSKIDEMLDLGIIAPARACDRNTSPTVIVPKDDGTVRIVTDFQALNEHVKVDQYPIADMNTVLRVVQQGKVFSKIDLTSSFFQMRLDEGSQHLTGFQVIYKGRSRKFIYLRAPMGFRNTPQAFSRLMNDVLSDLPGVVHFVDDILVQGQDWKENATRVKMVLKRLSEWHLRINPDKCKFGFERLEILGFVVQRGMLSPSPRKVEIILRWPIPRTLKEHLTLLGMFNFQRRFIKEAAMLVSNADRARDMYGYSSSEYAAAITALKEAVATAVSLHVYDPHAELTLRSDASVYRLGGIAMQGDKVVGYCSRPVTKAERALHPYRLEMRALLFTIQSFHDFCAFRHFTVETDSKALSMWRSSDHVSRVEARWWASLSAYDFSTKWIPGKSNDQADSLSRVDGKFVELPEDKPDAARESLATIMASVEIPRPDVSTPELRRKLILEVHQQGHFGVDLVVASLRYKCGVTWKGMHKEVKQVLASCDVCIRHKRSRSVYHPMVSVPSHGVWTDVAVDLACSFDQAMGMRFMMVVVDRFTTMTFLRPMPDKSSETIVHELAKLIAEQGPMRVLSTDCGAEWMNVAVKKFLAVHGIVHKPAAVAAHESQGVVETVIGHVKLLMRKLAQGRSDIWPLLCPEVMTMWNNRVSPSLGTSPAAMFRGREEVLVTRAQKEAFLAAYNQPPALSMEEIDALVSKAALHVASLPLLHDRIVRKRKQKLKAKAKKLNVSSLYLEPGTVVRRKATDVANKNAEPFPQVYVVHERVGKSYRLRTLDGAILENLYPRQHLRVQASQDDEPRYEIDKILGHATDEDGRVFYKVLWKGFPPSAATFEPAEFFDQERTIRNYRTSGRLIDLSEEFAKWRA